MNTSLNDTAKAWKYVDSEWFNSTVELDVGNGIGYMATLEVFHQCLAWYLTSERFLYPDGQKH